MHARVPTLGFIPHLSREQFHMAYFSHIYVTVLKITVRLLETYILVFCSKESECGQDNELT
jgi:hypothetical protein